MQGLTEFLPVSSSGHLVFVQTVLQLETSRLVFFDVMLHVGTLLAVLVFFRGDLFKIVEGVGRALKGNHWNDGARLLFWILVATLPTGLMGLLLKDWFESLFSRPKVVGAMLLVTGLVLWLTRFRKREGRSVEKMGWVDAILIGVAQGIAIIPGISRSGATISAGLFCGLDRELSGKFSFLLSIPAIAGATLLEARKIESVPEGWLTLMGLLAAFWVGFFSLKVLMKIIQRGKIYHFSYYCGAIGILMIFLIR